MSQFSTVEGISWDEIKESINFEVEDEGAFSEQTTTFLNKKAIMKVEEDDSRTPLGLVSPERPILHYRDTLDWVNKGLQESGVGYKVIDNVVDHKGNLFQQYLLDHEIDTPDGQSISPMMILKASYVQKPLEIMMGTYRFVCSNGTVVGNTIESFQIRPNELNDLLNRSISNEVDRGMIRMQKVSERYNQLAQEDMLDYLIASLQEKSLGVKIKKEMLYSLEHSGHITLPQEEDGIQLSKEAFESDHPENLFTLVNTDSGWSLYNVATNVSTHTTRSAQARNSADRAVSKVFAV